MSGNRTKETFGARFGALVRHKRGVEQLTQEALAERAFGNPSKKVRISELESGRTAAPHQTTIDAISVALNITPEEVQKCREWVFDSGRIDGLNILVKPGDEKAKWVDTYFNLGISLRAHGELVSDRDQIEEALDAFKSALSGTSRARETVRWARIMNEIARTMIIKGELFDDLPALRSAIETARDALSAVERSKHPTEWSNIMSNLGRGLQSHGIRISSNSELMESIRVFKEIVRKTST